MINWFARLFAAAPVPHPSDPFGVPEIAAMSARDLADLPLAPPPCPPGQARAAPVGGAAPLRVDRTRAAAI